MFQPVPPRYDTAHPGRPAARLDILSRGDQVGVLDVMNDDTVVSGSVSEKRVNGSRWSMSLEVRDCPQWRSWLQLPKFEVAPHIGMSWGQSEFLVPMGVYPVLPVGWDRPRKTLNLSATDRWQRLSDADFYGPVVSPTGLIRDLIRDLISAVVAGGTYPAETDASVQVTASSTATLGWPVIWPSAREKTILDLADSIGAEVFFDRYGRGIVRDRTWQPGVDLRATGDIATIRSSSSSTNWDDVRNVVIVKGTSNEVPDFPGGTARIGSQLNLAHPDRIGERVFRYSDASIVTQEQAQLAAAALLDRKSKPAVAFAVECLADPARECGDRLYLWPESEDTVDVTVESVTHDFFSGLQKLTLGVAA